MGGGLDDGSGRWAVVEEVVVVVVVVVCVCVCVWGGGDS
jgi:hypothetical protein